MVVEYVRLSVSMCICVLSAQFDIWTISAINSGLFSNGCSKSFKEVFFKTWANFCFWSIFNLTESIGHCCAMHDIFELYAVFIVKLCGLSNSLCCPQLSHFTIVQIHRQKRIKCKVKERMFINAVDFEVFFYAFAIQKYQNIIWAFRESR